MRIYSLASGSKGNCFILNFGNVNLMIDCGTTQKYLKMAMESLNINLKDIDALLITHEHSDHISQINMFKDLPIYSPIDIKDREIYKIVPLEKFNIKNIQILPLALSHDASITLGYIFNDGMQKIAYLTDTGYVNEKYYPLLKNMDYIIIESNHDIKMLMESNRPLYVKQRILSANGHLCNEDCADVLSNIIGNNTKGIMLAHISREANDYALALNTNIDYLLKCGIDLKSIEIKVCEQFSIVELGDKI